MENLVYSVAGTAIRSLDGFSEIQNIYSENYSVEEQALLDIAPAGSTASGKLRECWTVDGTYIDRAGVEKKSNGDLVGTDRYGYGNFVCEREYDESIGKLKNVWYPFLSGSKILNTLDIVNNLKDVATANEYDYVVDFLDFEVYNLADAELMYHYNNGVPDLDVGRTFIFPQINPKKVYTVTSFQTGKPVFSISDIPLAAFSDAPKKVKVNFSGIASWIFNIDPNTIVGSKHYDESSYLMVSGVDYSGITLSDLLGNTNNYTASRLKNNTNSNFGGMVFSYNGTHYTLVSGSKSPDWSLPTDRDEWYILKNASFDPTDFHKLRINVGMLRQELDPGKKRILLNMASDSTPQYTHSNFYSHSAYYTADVYGPGTSISFTGSGRGILRLVTLLKISVIVLQKDNAGVFQGKLEIPYDVIISTDPTTEVMSASIIEGSFSKIGTVLHPKLTYAYNQTDADIKFSIQIPSAVDQQFVCAAIVEDVLTPQYSAGFQPLE